MRSNIKIWRIYASITPKLLKAWDAEMVGIQLDKGTYVDDIVEILIIYHGGLFDQNRKEILIMMLKGESVTYPSQLGR